MKKKLFLLGGILLAFVVAFGVWFWLDWQEHSKIANLSTNESTDVPMPNIQIIDSTDPQEEEDFEKMMHQLAQKLQSGDKPKPEIIKGTHNADFDIDAIGKTIKLNGQPFPIPCTLNDLGPDYDFDSIIVGEPEDCAAGLSYLGESKAGLTLEGYVEGKEARRNVPIVGISSDFKYPYDEDWVLEVDGIKAGDTIDKVLAKYGEPDEKRILNSEEKNGIFKRAVYKYIIGSDALYFVVDPDEVKDYFGSDDTNVITDITYKNYHKK